MSGQPVRTAADENRFRNEYMETLALQEAINDMNLQANKTYLLTGQLPPSSQMQDTRTNAEKLADIEKMKRDIAEGLRPIAEPQFAYAIVNKIIESPLNLNGSLLRFLAQRVDSIVDQLKKLYKTGIRGDANDLEQIESYIKDMYAKQQGTFQSVKSYMNSENSTTSGTQKIVGSNDIDLLIKQVEDIIKMIDITIQRGVNKGGITGTRNVLQGLREHLKELSVSFPSSEDIQYLLSVISNPETKVEDYDRKTIEEFFTYVEKMPKYNQVITLIQKINMYLKTGNFEIAKQGINNLYDMINDGIPPIDILTKFHWLHKHKVMEKTEESQKLRDERKGIKTDKSEEEKDDGYSPLTYVHPAFEGLSADTILGHGIKKRRGRPRGKGITQVEKPPTFIGFGVNEINQRKLNDGILKIRRNTRTSFQDMPSKRISPTLQRIIKTVVGGGMPNYNDLSSLNEEEKEYLHKIVTRSNMEDKLSVPAPSKDQQEKDIHNFEVMKGQIMSGNDSIELVKKFKLLIRKLAKQGLLPKNDVEDIMETLFDLGY